MVLLLPRVALLPCEFNDANRNQSCIISVNTSWLRHDRKPTTQRHWSVMLHLPNLVLHPKAASQPASHRTDFKSQYFFGMPRVTLKWTRLVSLRPVIPWTGVRRCLIFSSLFS
ncbi:hypothetical protein Pcinc_017251 [Petrolisthes cinctipes]|uniref:Uncharacterized protein n=1 Tax=Petrolisthes cinctipes TaxID=88211 RepID=A0AAE1KMZ8_PETCI|nr:hypothetical protein Pcinc_017251 [Petrolisthes cinctipes]